ncbi:hypothetical protein F1C16_17800 [Hymenobacter sp. NBH84]|uniref:M56 family metallopeptidase n=1 Tax=Hymenobacter sp. NBH84 TaxID=2596915 RepID=UPI001626C5F2|nr:M56 family metallopeptidase [Hymenobacter sp. NBH84]QNE41275.1 hypothetical protein F1C16_17800 [Hymenobacter sp. NBH84]
MMPTSLLLYLAEVSFGTLVFALLYQLVFARLPTFRWNRWYLLVSLAASFALPLLVGFASRMAPTTGSASSGPLPALPLQWTLAATSTSPLLDTPDYLHSLGWVVLAVYAAGVCYQVWRTSRSLRQLHTLVTSHDSIRLPTGRLVQLPTQTLPAFSFGPFIFLSSLHKSLSETERQLLLRHEQVHVRQHHTLDLLGYEVAGWLLWFNPAVRYLGRQVRQVHEYLADATVAQLPGIGIRHYGNLLLKLVAQQPPFHLTHTFSSSILTQRILMLTTSVPTRWQKLRFLLVVPVAAMAWAVTSYAGSPLPPTSPSTATASSSPTTAQTGPTIRRITWRGNKVVSSARLTQALGLATGSAYDSTALSQRLNYRPDGVDVTSLYMDQGYLFFSIEPSVVPQPNGTVDLVFTISEGKTARLGKITLQDTRTPAVSTAPLLAQLPLRTGDLFSRKKLLESQKLLATANASAPTAVHVNPIPVIQPGGAATVNIEFVLQPK